MRIHVAVALKTCLLGCGHERRRGLELSHQAVQRGCGFCVCHQITRGVPAAASPQAQSSHLEHRNGGQEPDE